MTLAVRRLGLDELPSIGPAVICLGVFDGVHRGHVAMLSTTRDAAAARGVAAVALVFDPPPDEVLQPGHRTRRLAPVATVLERIEGDLALTAAIPLRFDDELRSHAAEDFLSELAPSVVVRGLVMSPESAFGRGRGGSVERMRRLGPERGFDVLVVEPVMVEGVAVTSSRIRTTIAAGDIDAALRMGYPPRLEGTVVTGDRRGRELGFPTANLAFDYLPAMPPLGVYVARVAAPQRGVGPGHPALVSVGVRPTFHDDGRVLVEAYLLDYDGDLYGTRLSLDLVARLRDERRFPDADALVEQMRRDEATARIQLADA